MTRTTDRVNSTSVNKAANLLQKKIVYDANDNPIYIGTAPRNSDLRNFNS